MAKNDQPDFSLPMEFLRLGEMLSIMGNLRRPLARNNDRPQISVEEVEAMVDVLLDKASKVPATRKLLGLRSGIARDAGRIRLKAAKIRRLVASTYQAVSGTGSAAVKELEAQAKAWAAGQPLTHDVYPHQIAFNLLPCVGSFKDDSGESTEEIKMRKETHKILGDDTIRVATTCVRVPVFNGHSIAIHAEFEKPLSPETARNLLAKTAGVRLVDEPKNAVYPMPIHASGNYDVLVGRLRKDHSADNGLVLWCCGDNIWKGAAQNAIQIGEVIIERNYFLK